MPQWKRELIKKQRKGREESPPTERKGKGGRHGNRRNKDSSEDERDKKKGQRRHRRHDNNSDEDSKKRKGKSDGKKGKKNSKRDSYYSDHEDEKRKGKKGKQTKDKRGNKKKGPTNVDDYDSEDSYSSETSDGSTSTEEYSDSEERRKAAQLAGGAWALGEGDTLDNLDTRIRDQQLTIQQELSNLTRLQRDIGLKTLPTLQQKVLQADLSKLQDLQSRLKETPGHRELQVQLVGQQMMLTEHLREIQESLSHKLPDVETHLENLTQRKLSHSTSTTSITGMPPPPTANAPTATQLPQPIIQQPMTQPMTQPIIQPTVVQQPLAQPMVQSMIGQIPTANTYLQPQPMYMDPLATQMAAAHQQQQLLMRQQLAASAEYQRQLDAQRNRFMMLNGAAMSGAMYSPLTPSIPFM